jgi:aminobenzoyl-glutamate utilization protein B
MTETTVKERFIKSSSNIIPNHTLGSLLYQNMEKMPVPKATEEELAYAAKLQASMEESVNSLEYLVNKASPDKKDFIRAHYGQKINDFLVPYTPFDDCQSYSTDIGDVSWICPTSQIGATTWVANSMEHTWQVVAQGKSNLAHSGTVYAAKILGSTAIDLLENPSVLEAAKAELKERLGGESYISPIPPEVKPSL